MIAKDYVRTHADQILRQLVEFARLPNNVSVPAQIQANAQFLAGMMEQRGIAAEIWPTPSGRPLVFGELQSPGATRTILIYGHYDGVPVEPSQWHSEPYEPVLRSHLPRPGAGADWSTIPWPADGAFDGEWRLFGRSVADSKNGIVAVLAALDALHAEGRDPGVNLKFLFDGEEEAESPGLPAILQQHAERLRADCVIAACGELHQSGLATVQLGVRGILVMELTAYASAVDMHSGHFGGFAPSAPFRLIHLLATMKDADGQVTIPSFYDDVLSMSPAELEAIRAVPAVEESVCRKFGVVRPEGAGRSLQEIINRPTFNIRGLGAGFLSKDARNIVPGRATAEIDIRLVKGMDPGRTLACIAAHIESLGWTLLDHEPTYDELMAHPQVASLKVSAAFPATRTPLDAPIARYVVGAVRQAVGSQPLVLPTEGGSIPMNLFEQVAPAFIGLPPSNFDCNQHTHDENLQLSTLFRAVEVFAEVFQGER